MNLYLIKLKVSPNFYDFIDSMVILADSENRARILAGMSAEQEGAESWLNNDKSVIKPIGRTYIYKNEEVILTSFNAG